MAAEDTTSASDQVAGEHVSVDSEPSVVERDSVFIVVLERSSLGDVVPDRACDESRVGRRDESVQVTCPGCWPACCPGTPTASPLPRR